jgi:hypothetical protein
VEKLKPVLQASERARYGLRTGLDIGSNWFHNASIAIAKY